MTTPTHTEDATVFTIPEIAERLKISQWLVREEIRMRRLPVVRIGRRVLVTNSDLKNYIARQRNEARGGTHHGF